MRLMNTSTGQLCWFHDRSRPRFAILSHVWEKQEQTYQDLVQLSPKTSVFTSIDPPLGDSEVSHCDKCEIEHPILKSEPSSLIHKLSPKLRGAREYAVKLGFCWIWADTSCIDKTSSAELSEAINSMFMWYSEAAECIAYLSDVPDDMEDPSLRDSGFCKSKWFTRGWTLQELLAPRSVKFVSKGWKGFGTREALGETIAEITGIEIQYHGYESYGGMKAKKANIATRMKWASSRNTTRIEDEAYSLLGIFNLYMPVIYGEGRNAFRRLQEGLLGSSPDQSLFAWHNSNRFDPYPNNSVLAVQPSDYSQSSDDMSPITLQTVPTAVAAFLTSANISFQGDLAGQKEAGIERILVSTFVLIFSRLVRVAYWLFPRENFLEAHLPSGSPVMGSRPDFLSSGVDASLAALPSLSLLYTIPLAKSMEGSFSILP